MTRLSIEIFLLVSIGAASLAGAAEKEFDPCSLLTRTEIQAVQGNRVTATKASAPERAGFAVSQCFYTLSPFSKSVSLEVTRRRAGEAESPRRHWRAMFDAERARKDGPGEREGDEGREKESAPRRIAGVGDDAYWVGPATGGGLHVLSGDAFFRLSLGGSDPEPVKIRKLVKLARAAVKRL